MEAAPVDDAMAGPGELEQLRTSKGSTGFCRGGGGIAVSSDGAEVPAKFVGDEQV